MEKAGCGCTGRVMSEDELDAIYNESGDLYLECFYNGKLFHSKLKKHTKRVMHILGDMETLFCEINRLRLKCGERKKSKLNLLGGKRRG